MKNSIYNNGVVLGIILVFFSANIVPNISGNLIEQNNIITISLDNTISETSTTDIPIWTIDDSWIYALELMFSFEETDVEISFDLSTSNLLFTVNEKNSDSYHLNIQGDLSGDFTFSLEGYPTVKGTLKDTKITGTSTVEQTTLGIETLNLQIDGRLSLAGLIPIPLDIDFPISFNPSYHTLAFPLAEGNQWNVDPSMVTINGTIKMPGIASLFPAIPEEIPIIIEDLTVGGSEAYCHGKESIALPAGQYTAYNITFNDETKVYYADAVGNVISIVPSLSSFEMYDIAFTFELVSTTYVDPEAPNVPEPPDGTKKGKLKTEYTYSTMTTDPQSDQIFYLFDWGDGTNSGWLGPYNSGAICEATHTWTKKGNYNIKVQAKDINDAESLWSDPLPISMPYSINRPLFQFFEFLLQQFLQLFPVLQNR